MSERIEDLVEIQQLLARYAVTITQEDIDGLVAVFTPDGTYSAFGAWDTSIAWASLRVVTRNRSLSTSI